MPVFYRRLKVLPFDTVIALLALGTGVLGLLDIGGVSTDALSLQLPTLLLAITQGVYAFAGALMLLGIGFARGRVELIGVVFIAAGVIIRAAALLTLLGITPPVVVSLWFNGWVLWACYQSVGSIARGETVVRLKEAEKP